MSAFAPTVAMCRNTTSRTGTRTPGLILEEWRASLAAEGWEPELPELAEGAELRLEGRTVRRHAVRRWVPDKHGN